MKPQRVRMTHDLIVNYGLYPKMSIFRPRLLGQADLCKFHDPEYISFLKNISLAFPGISLASLFNVDFGFIARANEVMFPLWHLLELAQLSGEDLP